MKKLMSIVLALCMALSLCVTTAWADTTVTTAEDLQNAIEQGTDTYIKLGADIVLDPANSSHMRVWNTVMSENWTDTYLFCKVSRPVTLDLNGHKISYAQTPYTPSNITNDNAVYVFVLVSGADMTVTGNGTIDSSLVAGEGVTYLSPICLRLHTGSNAKLTVENGTFLTNVPTPFTNETNHNVLLVKQGGGVATVNGGYFEVKGGRGLALNIGYGWNDSTQINVNGATITGDFNTGDSKPTDGQPVAEDSSKKTHYIGSKAIAEAVNSGGDVTVTTGGAIDGIKGGSINVANGATGVTINGVAVTADGASGNSTTINVRKVSFLDGETVLSEVGVVNGQKVEKPADPTRDGYTFVCWLDGDGATCDFEKAVTDDLTLTAQWEEVESSPAHTPIRRQNTAVTTSDTKADDTTKTDTVISAKTFDAGVSAYAAMAVLSLTGSAWVVGKKRV